MSNAEQIVTQEQAVAALMRCFPDGPVRLEFFNDLKKSRATMRQRIAFQNKWGARLRQALLAFIENKISDPREKKQLEENILLLHAVGETCSTTIHHWLNNTAGASVFSDQIMVGYLQQMLGVNIQTVCQDGVRDGTSQVNSGGVVKINNFSNCHFEDPNMAYTSGRGNHCLFHAVLSVLEGKAFPQNRTSKAPEARLAPSSAKEERQQMREAIRRSIADFNQIELERGLQQSRECAATSGDTMKRKKTQQRHDWLLATQFCEQDTVSQQQIYDACQRRAHLDALVLDVGEHVSELKIRQQEEAWTSIQARKRQIDADEAIAQRLQKQQAKVDKLTDWGHFLPSVSPSVPACKVARAFVPVIAARQPKVRNTITLSMLRSALAAVWSMIRPRAASVAKPSSLIESKRKVSAPVQLGC